MLPSAPSNGAQAAAYDYAEAHLGIYLNAAGNAWPELRAQLLRICHEKVAPLAFVPSDWIDQVATVCGTSYAPQLMTPYVGSGAVRATAPVWLTKDKAAMDAWHAIAGASRQAVMDYSQGKINEGRAELDKLYRDAAFWDGLYRATKFVADLPANAVGAVGDGAGYVLGGVFGSLAKSWVFWLLALGAGGFAAFKFGFLGKLLKKARGT